jgi:hypothetical protein
MVTSQVERVVVVGEIACLQQLLLPGARGRDQPVRTNGVNAFCSSS